MRIYLTRSRVSGGNLEEDYRGTDRQIAMDTYLGVTSLEETRYAEVGYLCPQGEFIELKNSSPVFLSKTNWDGL